MPRLPFNLSSSHDGPIRSVADAAALGWPVLGSIAEFERQAGGHRACWDWEDALEAYQPLAEAVRLPNFHVRGRAIVVASAPGGAGGTTTARNLASLLSRGGSDTILVDSNPKRVARRRPGDGTSSSGFAGLLMNQLMRPENALTDTENARLKLLPAGSTASDSNELLRSSRLIRVVDGLRELADYVVFDSGSVAEDLTQLTRLADVTLIVIRSGRTSQQVASSAVTMLAESTTGQRGIVLNRAPALLLVATPAARAEETSEAPGVSDETLEIAVEGLLADLEATLALIHELRQPTARSQIRDEESDANLVTMER